VLRHFRKEEQALFRRLSTHHRPSRQSRRLALEGWLIRLSPQSPNGEVASSLGVSTGSACIRECSQLALRRLERLGAVIDAGGVPLTPPDLPPLWL
jgi:hypothetical protein